MTNNKLIDRQLHHNISIDADVDADKLESEVEAQTTRLEKTFNCVAAYAISTNGFSFNVVLHVIPSKDADDLLLKDGIHRCANNILECSARGELAKSN